MVVAEQLKPKAYTGIETIKMAASSTRQQAATLATRTFSLLMRPTESASNFRH